MKRKRRSFTPEFKLEAASHVLDQGTPYQKPAARWMLVKPYCVAG